MLKKFLIFIFVVLSFYLVIILYLYFNQEKNIFFPAKGGEVPPSDLKINEIFFKTDDGEELHGWWMDNDAENTVLFFHGNAGNLSGRVSQMRIFKDLNLNAFIFDYRGYGKSSGEIKKEVDLYIDGMAAWNFITKVKNVREENVIIWGRSLGGGIAIDLAQNKNVKNVIIESTFYSMINFASGLYPWAPINLLLKYRIDSGNKLKNIKAPILIIHSKEDESISFENGQKLYESAVGQKEFFEIRGGHNDGVSLSEEKYKEYLQSYINKK